MVYAFVTLDGEVIKSLDLTSFYIPTAQQYHIKDIHSYLLSLNKLYKSSSKLKSIAKTLLRFFNPLDQYYINFRTICVIYCIFMVL